MLRWGTSTPVAASSSSSSVIEDATSGSFSLSQQQHDETSSSSPEPQEPSGALLVDEDETDDEDDDDGDEMHQSMKTNRGDKRKRARDEDNSGGDHVEPDEDDDEADSEDLHPAWHPQNVQSTTEFTHIITDYANKRESGCKKAEYSEITVDDHGNRWRLIIYVNGNGRASNHHLSLFLQVADADDLPFGWKKSVSYILTLEHPNGSTFSYAKRNPDKTFKLCPKAIDWGWSQFITSDRIQQEGFVSDDSLRVRASVTVKFSSVSIDEEDSELYLKCAVEEGDADAVELCLENGASVNCQFKDDLYTPLHTACSSGSSTGSMEVLEILLERGADCNACNKWRETPLLIAANNGHRLGVAALLKHGADPSLCSEAGWSALTFAAHKGYDDIVALLLRAGAPVNSRVSEDLSTPLHKACAGSKPGHLASVKLLLDANADVHALNKWRETPLLTAANHGQSGAVEVLLSRGADPCKCTDTGWSPLSIAAYKGHDDVVRLLLEEGAPTEEDDPTLSALLQAATKGLPDTVELLLQHGADHTVTTKKGDTALSILVEQNLIDAAVEMVTQYNASIPRCSRDRKKVQRARLLINLRMKQLEREGRVSLDDESENDMEGEDAETTLAQHVANGFDDEPPPTPNNKKKGKPKVSAEEKAKAAEEALLQELEKEEEEARKEEAEASKKQAKKKKKKEKERLQKLKEEKERREKEEQERKEAERIRQEKEEQERKLREQKVKDEKEREMKEMMRREKTVQEKRKVKDRKDRHLPPKREEKVVKDSPQSPNRIVSANPAAENKAKHSKTKRASVAPAAQGPAHCPAERAAAPSVQSQQPEGNRRWETKGKLQPQGNALKKTSEMAVESRNPSRPDFMVEPHRGMPSPPSRIVSAPPPSVQPQHIVHQYREGHISPVSNRSLNGFSHRKTKGGVEIPPVVLYRKEKVEELLRCSELVQNVLDITAVKRIVTRWITRAHHGDDPYIDPIIPSWVDESKGIVFFQRQFISESRRLDNVVNMEALKNAGSAFAALCREMAEDVEKFTVESDEQAGLDWTDASMGMIYQSPTASGAQTISWNNRYQVFIPDATMDLLRARFNQPTCRMLSALFTATVYKEIIGLVLADTGMDVRLSPRAQTSLTSELEVSVELNSDAFIALPHVSFCGVLEEVDSIFGGMKPFTKDECLGLRENGGSCSVLLPFETMVAAQYIGRMLDLIHEANIRQTPLSFAVFVSNLSLHDPSRVLSRDELRCLDGRLESFKYPSEFVPRSVNGFWSLEVDGEPKPATGDTMILILQSEQGKQRFMVHESTLPSIVQSMGSSAFNEHRSSPPPLLSEPFRTDYGLSSTPASPYFLTPEPAFGAGAFAENGMHVRYASAPAGGVAPSLPFDLCRGSSGPTTRRGRLFDLVDNDVEEDSSVDLVAGMLDNLDVGLFQNGPTGSGDVDIEAISLMGINTAGQTMYGSHSSNPFG